MSLEPGTLYYGDNLDWMSQWDDQCVDLIYADPPFNSKTDYNVLYSNKSGELAQFRAFSDTWVWDTSAEDRLESFLAAVGRPAHKMISGLHQILGESGMLAYLTYMAERLEHMHRLLKPTGSIYLHCDPTMSHYLKALMDGVFGPENFRNEIIWRRTGSHNKLSLQYGPIHDVILFYSGGVDFTFSPGRTPYTRQYIKKQFRKSDRKGQYRPNELTGSGTRKGFSGMPWRGYDPTPKGRHWAIPRVLRETLPEVQRNLKTQDLLDALHETGDLIVSESTFPRYRQRKGEGVLYQDIWAHQPGTQGMLDASGKEIDRDVKWLDSESENLGYPTQKPLGLLKRIIETSSKRGELVLDPFCGCGTTVIATQYLGRKWAGIDISSYAVDLISKRLHPFPCQTQGIPQDHRSARKLAREKPFEFESWAVTRLPGFAPNTKQRGDGGVDGRAMIAKKPINWKSRLALAQIKGGGFKLGELRDFIHVTDRDNAALGVYVTLDPVTSSAARTEAAKAKTVTIGADRYPRCQVWPIAHYFEERRPHLPTMTDPYTGKPLSQRGIFGGLFPNA